MKSVCVKCKKEFDREGTAYFPFCSKRCQALDFGAWVTGQYSIPAGPVVVDTETGEVIDMDDEGNGEGGHNPH